MSNGVALSTSYIQQQKPFSGVLLSATVCCSKAIDPHLLGSERQSL